LLAYNFVLIVKVYQILMVQENEQVYDMPLGKYSK